MAFFYEIDEKEKITYRGPICQTVDQSFPVFYDHTFKPVAPKVTAPVVALIIISGKPHLYFTDKFGEAGQFLSQG